MPTARSRAASSNAPSAIAAGECCHCWRGGTTWRGLRRRWMSMCARLGEGEIQNAEFKMQNECASFCAFAFNCSVEFTTETQRSQRDFSESQIFLCVLCV